MSYRLTAIDPTIADDLRARGGPVFIADEQPGYPCRQCLQDAAIGEALVLVSYDPFSAPSPYRSASPIFLHLDACEPYTPAPGLPAQLTGRQLSVRAFDDDAMMLDAALIDGVDLDAMIVHFLANPEIRYQHVHNAVRGCWAVAVHRA